MGFVENFKLNTPSFHLDLITFCKNLQETLDNVAPLGAKYLVLPALSDINERKTLDHYKDANEKVRFKGDGGKPDQWMALFSKNK